MSKVFEALERERKSKIKENRKSALATKTDGAEDENPLGSDDFNGDHTTEVVTIREFSEPAAETGAYGLPTGIGAPIGPRSKDGILFPSRNVTLHDESTGGPIEQAPPLAPSANGKLAFSAEQSAMSAGN